MFGARGLGSWGDRHTSLETTSDNLVANSHCRTFAVFQLKVPVILQKATCTPTSETREYRQFVPKASETKAFGKPLHSNFGKDSIDLDWVPFVKLPTHPINGMESLEVFSLKPSHPSRQCTCVSQTSAIDHSTIFHPTGPQSNGPRWGGNLDGSPRQLSHIPDREHTRRFAEYHPEFRGKHFAMDIVSCSPRPIPG
jgi:hypothetical protein